MNFPSVPQTNERGTPSTRETAETSVSRNGVSVHWGVIEGLSPQGGGLSQPNPLNYRPQRVWTLTLRGLDHVNYPNQASGGGVSHWPLRSTVKLNYPNQASGCVCEPLASEIHSEAQLPTATLTGDTCFRPCPSSHLHVQLHASVVNFTPPCRRPQRPQQSRPSLQPRPSPLPRPSSQLDPGVPSSSSSPP